MCDTHPICMYFFIFFNVGIHSVDSCKVQMNTVVGIDGGFTKYIQDDVEMFIHILKNNIKK